MCGYLFVEGCKLADDCFDMQTIVLTPSGNMRELCFGRVNEWMRGPGTCARSGTWLICTYFSFLFPSSFGYHRVTEVTGTNHLLLFVSCSLEL